ncbi:MAG: glutamate decarboxylase [Malacoplasma sp.]
MPILHTKLSLKKYNGDTKKINKEIGDREVVTFEMPTTKLTENIVPAYLAYKSIKEELMDEGNARMNLATFCQTSMEPEAIRLISETLEKNAIDKSEYPQTTEIENRCVAILADLWHHNEKDGEFIGTSTIGSSEACMLGGMVLKFRWLDEIDKLVKANVIKDDPRRKPNIIISSAFQVCWEKFCVYWDIEMRCIPIDEKHMSLDPKQIEAFADENTIGVVAILGITYTGTYDDVLEIDRVVKQYNIKYDNKRPPLKIHVDGASGGFFAPFVSPYLKWDFSLENVVSISASGHKYGLVYPGIGWVLWKDKKFVSEKLIFEVSYLGGKLATMAINFSHSASQMLGQYYQFLRLGKKGYTAIQLETRSVGLFFSSQIEKMNYFRIINDGNLLPIICWTLKEADKVNWTLFDLSDELLTHGWQVPAYPLPKNMENVYIQRIVVRADLTMDLATQFIDDMKRSIEKLNSLYKDDKSASYNEKNKIASGFTH